MDRTLETTICMLKNKDSNNNMPILFLLGELSGESNHAWLDLKSRDSKYKIIDYPELEEQIECVATGYGWLLILSGNSSSLFFFNPSTRQRIDLPYRNTFITAAAFSAPPTSPDCTVFTIRLHRLGRVRIETWSVGQETWTHHSIVPLDISQQDPFFYSGAQVIYNNGRFYCVDSYGRLATFDLKSMTWNLVRGMEIERTWSYTGTLYLFEFNGEIFAVMKGSDNLAEKTFIRLKIEGGKYAWKAEELDYLGQDVTLFLGPYGSCAVSSSINVLGEKKKKKKKVFVADHKPQSKCLVRKIDHNGGSKKMIIPDARLFGWEYAPIRIQSTQDPIWDDVILN